MPKFPLLRKVSAEALVVPTVVVLVGVGAFGLGRLSALQEQKGELKVYEAPQSEPLVLGVAVGEYVASKGGTKYYLPTCSGATRILPENRVWFATVAEAQVAGYTAAANCSGL